MSYQRSNPDKVVMWIKKYQEPVELQILKQKLANLSNNTCKCLNNESGYNFIDKEVQIIDRNTRPIDQFTQIEQHTPIEYNVDFMRTVTKDAFFASFFAAVSLLREGVGVIKTLKDKEAEAKTEISSCDKSTEKIVIAVEKTTSVTGKPTIKLSNLTLSDFISDDDLTRNGVVKRSPQQVHFGDFKPCKTQQTTVLNGCICLESYINSIRPPLK